MLNPLDLLEQRIMSCYHEACDLQAGRMCSPRDVVVYPTLACNHRCLGCDYANLRSCTSMTTDQLFSVVNQVKELGALAWHACGGGEPTLHPDLHLVIEQGAAIGLKFGLLTNGTRLDEPALLAALIRHASYVRVSLESATEATFNAYKRPRQPIDGFQHVVENIRGMIAARNAAGSQMQVGYKFAIGRQNYRDIPAAFDLAEQFGVDSLQIKCLRNVAEELNPRELDEARQMIESGTATHPRLRLIGSLEKTSIRERCWLSPLVPTIAPEGNVYLCCYYRHRQDKHSIGNMFERPLRDLWYSRRHWQAIEQIDPAECNVYDCRMHIYHEIMGELMRDGQLEFV